MFCVSEQTETILGLEEYLNDNDQLILSLALDTRFNQLYVSTLLPGEVKVLTLPSS